MSRTLLALLFPVALVAAGCHHWVVVDGIEVAYVDVDLPVARYPRYAYRGGYVYEVNGEYYRQVGRRWAVYRHRPRDLPREYDRNHHHRR